MKKFIIAIIATFLMFCCNDRNETSSQIETVQEDIMHSFASSARVQGLSEEELIEYLSNDEEFIQLGDDLIDFFAYMPKRDEFVLNYNQEHFNNLLIEENNVNESLNYFTTMAGYSRIEYDNFASSVDVRVNNLYDKYPQLVFDGTNQDFIDNVLEGASNNITTLGKLDRVILQLVGSVQGFIGRA